MPAQFLTRKKKNNTFCWKQQKMINNHETYLQQEKDPQTTAKHILMKIVNEY